MSSDWTAIIIQGVYGTEGPTIYNIVQLVVSFSRHLNTLLVELHASIPKEWFLVFVV